MRLGVGIEPWLRGQGGPNQRGGGLLLNRAGEGSPDEFRAVCGRGPQSECAQSGVAAVLNDPDLGKFLRQIAEVLFRTAVKAGQIGQSGSDGNSRRYEEHDRSVSVQFGPWRPASRRSASSSRIRTERRCSPI